jgi:release factor glutamine methyltransferase
MSFASALLPRLNHQVDVVLFNPPYVPTMSEEAQNAQQVGSLSGAWAGGQDGMRVTNFFLDQVEVRFICVIG